MALILILIAGGVSYYTIPKESSPDISVPFAYVNMHLEGISPEDAERMLVRPMEKELRALDGLKEMRATAYEGGANIILEFEAGLDIDPVIQDVRDKVDIAKSELPSEADEPTVTEINLALQPVIVVSLSGAIPERQLVRTAKDLRDELEGIAEVLEVQIAGDREEVVELVIDPEILNTYELRLDEIAQAAARNNVLVAAGTMDNGAGRLSVKVPGLFETAEDLFNLPIKTVGDTVIRVRDIATVRPTFKDATSFSRVNGVPSITLRVVKRVGENVIATVEQVREIVAERQATWPEGLQVTFSQDQSDDIRDMLADLQNNVISAILLVMIVCIGALGVRSGILVGIAIPGSFLAGIIVISMMGLTVNMVVLFALILAVGMLVDGAIVVVELADRKMNEGLPRAQAYLIASQRMAGPIISSTLTTLAAFAPLLFWPGIVGEFMKYLPITLIATLCASLLMALIFVPTVGALIGKPGPASKEAMKSLAAAEGGDFENLKGITGWYVRLLEKALKTPFMIFFGVCGLFVAVLFSYGAFGKGVEFFADVDPEFSSVLVRMRGNLSIHEMDSLVQEVEERIQKVDGIDSVTAQSGISFSEDGTTADTHGLIQLEFANWKTRPTGRAIMDEIDLRTQGVQGITLTEVDKKGSEDLRVEIAATMPMTASRMKKSIRGVLDRLALVSDFEVVDRVDGSRLSRQTGPRTIATLSIIPVKKKAEERNWVVRLWKGFFEKETLSVEAGINAWISEYEKATVVWAQGDDSDEGLPLLRIESEAGDSLLEEYRLVEGVVKELSEIEGVQHIEQQMGEWTSAASRTERVVIAEVGLSFKDGKAIDFDRLMEDVLPFIRGVAGVIVEQKAVEAGPPVGKDIQIELSSYNPELLHRATSFVREKMERVEGLRDVGDTRPVPGVEWQVEVDRAEASRYGADIALVGSYIQFVTNGLMLGTYRPDGADDEIDIRARFPGKSRSLSEIGQLRVVTEKGVVPVGNFIAEKPAPLVGKIDRVDGRRIYTVSANVDENYLPDQKVKELEQWRETIDLPEGLFVRFRGQDEEQAKAMAFLMKAFGIALFVMAIILVTQFNSFYQALLILIAVIFSTIGVFLGLMITGYPFSVVMNGIGVISLAGIVVNNNIVLIDTYDHLHRSGIQVYEAIVRTCAQRLRPVLLTSVTTSLGLLPMMLKMNIDFAHRDITFNAPSTQWWVQLSTSVGFGLIFATALTLIVTPALLLIGHQVGQYFKDRRSTSAEA